MRAVTQQPGVAEHQPRHQPAARPDDLVFIITGRDVMPGLSCLLMIWPTARMLAPRTSLAAFLPRAQRFRCPPPPRPGMRGQLSGRRSCGIGRPERPASLIRGSVALQQALAVLQARRVQRVVATLLVDEPFPWSPYPGRRGRVPCAGRGQARGPGPWLPAAQGPRRSRGPGRPAGPSRSDAQQPGGWRGGPVCCAAPSGDERRRQPPPLWPWPVPGARSGGRAGQELIQRLRGGLPAQGLAGPGIQLIGDRGQVLPAVHGQAGALGEVLAQRRTPPPAQSRPAPRAPRRETGARDLP